MKSGPPAAQSTPKAAATGSARAGAKPADRCTVALGVAVAALEAAAQDSREKKACVARALLAAREAVECALRQQVAKPNAGASPKPRTGGGPGGGAAAGKSSESPLAAQVARLALELAAQAAPARESFKPAGALAAGASRQNPFVGVCLTSAPRIERKASCSCGSERAPDAIGRQLLTLALQVVCDELADSGFLDASDRSTQSTVQQSPKAHSAPARARPQPALPTRSGAGAGAGSGSALRRVRAAFETSSPHSDYSEHSVADAGTQTWAHVPSNLARLLARHAISEAITALLDPAVSSVSATATPSVPPSAAPQRTPQPPFALPPDALLAGSRCSSASRSFVPTESSVSIPFALDSYASSCCVDVDDALPESLPLDACHTALRALERALEELDAELAAPSGAQLVQLRALSQPPLPFAERARSTHAVEARGARSARASNGALVPTAKSKSNLKLIRNPTPKPNVNTTRAPSVVALSDAELLQSCAMRVSSLAAGAIVFAMRELRSLMSVSVNVNVNVRVSESECASMCEKERENRNRVRVAHSEPLTRTTRSASSSLYSRVSVRESLTQVSRNPSGRRPLCIRGTRTVPLERLHLSALTQSTLLRTAFTRTADCRSAFAPLPPPPSPVVFWFCFCWFICQ